MYDMNQPGGQQAVATAPVPMVKTYGGKIVPVGTADTGNTQPGSVPVTTPGFTSADYISPATRDMLKANGYDKDPKIAAQIAYSVAQDANAPKAVAASTGNTQPSSVPVNPGGSIPVNPGGSMPVDPGGSIPVNPGGSMPVNPSSAGVVSTASNNAIATDPSTRAAQAAQAAQAAKPVSTAGNAIPVAKPSPFSSQGPQQPVDMQTPPSNALDTSSTWVSKIDQDKLNAESLKEAKYAANRIEEMRQDVTGKAGTGTMNAGYQLLQSLKPSARDTPEHKANHDTQLAAINKTATDYGISAQLAAGILSTYSNPTRQKQALLAAQEQTPAGKVAAKAEEKARIIENQKIAHSQAVALVTGQNNAAIISTGESAWEEAAKTPGAQEAYRKAAMVYGITPVEYAGIKSTYSGDNQVLNVVLDAASRNAKELTAKQTAEDNVIQSVTGDNHAKFLAAGDSAYRLADADTRRGYTAAAKKYGIIPAEYAGIVKLYSKSPTKMTIARNALIESKGKPSTAAPTTAKQTAAKQTAAPTTAKQTAAPVAPATPDTSIPDVPNMPDYRPSYHR